MIGKYDGVRLFYWQGILIAYHRLRCLLQGSKQGAPKTKRPHMRMLRRAWVINLYPSVDGILSA